QCQENEAAQPACGALRVADTAVWEDRWQLSTNSLSREHGERPFRGVQNTQLSSPRVLLAPAQKGNGGLLTQ
ncbi:hypothetical protein M9458_035472, partial [Cirrhinus mrigala]